MAYMAYGNFIFSQARCKGSDRAKGNGSDRTGHHAATRRPGGVLTAAIIAAALLLAGPAAAEPPLSGTARIVDGDTLEIAGQKVRLLGLDAPEGKQVCQRDGRPWRCGDAAAAVLRDIVAGRGVRCDVRGLDRWGRSLAVCQAGDTDLAREMVRRGMAVAHYPKRGVRGPTYDDEHADAKTVQRGLWGGAFVRPADWRKGAR